MDGFMGSMYLFRFSPQFSVLVPLATAFADYLPPKLAILFRELKETIPAHIKRATENRQAGTMTIFSELLDSDLPESEKTVFRFTGDDFSLTAGGTETTAMVLTKVGYYLLTQPQVRARHVHVLEGAQQQMEGENPLSWASLEQIPYLYGVVNETLRLSYGICCRLVRIARTEDLVYYQKEGLEYFIPRGTPIGMSSYLTHHDEDIFPDSYEFLPERWIMPKGERNTALEKHLVPFGKGSRICLGMK
ncbi:cytochrome P450 [Apiospora marii]|uniref:Cytochrome P450 n=1 Tax=Apiospora marii TaxID=335849 RepID=A0ABR1SPQ3_9PEZI